MKATVNRQQAEAIHELTLLHGLISILYDYGSYLIVTAANLGRTKVWTTGKVEAAP